jgi:hypothetical protein
MRKVLWALPAASFAIAVLANGNRSAGGSHAGNTVKVNMHNVQYHFTDDIAVHIEALQGELVPTAGSAIPVFDDKNSFTLKIYASRIGITPESLAAVLNSREFGAPDAPLKDIQIELEKGELKMKGKLHGKGDVPVEVKGILSATREGKIRVHAKAIKALHVPVKGLMDLFGIEIGNVIKTGKLAGVRAEKDDLILDPGRLLPPPQIEGKVSGIRLEGNSIVQVFGSPQKAEIRQIQGNYMQYAGNRLQFGKLTMSATDLVLLDMDPKDSFDFYLDHYKEQLVAGYTKTTSTFGLRVYMRDFNKLSH